MTVEQAVMRVIISHVERGERRIPNHLIEHAHPKHQMSGRARLRGLRQKGYVTYASRKDNTYEILSDLQSLYQAWKELTGRRWTSEFRRKREEEAMEKERVSLEEIRRFRQTVLED